MLLRLCLGGWLFMGMWLSAMGQGVVPDDPLYARQWHLHNSGQSGGNNGSDIGAQVAWEITTGGNTVLGDSIVICLIDNGIARNHPDLQANIWHNILEIPHNGKDDDQNGFVDDFQGWNVYEKNDQVEASKHGTPLAGIMAACGNNQIGISGINWRVKLMPVVGGFLNESTVVEAYLYPLIMRRLYDFTLGEKGAYVVVVNASWGRRNLREAQFPAWCGIYDSLGKAGILSVGSVVNDRLDIDQMGDMPTSCSSPFLITVSNSDHHDNRVPFAGFGKYSVDLVAPGEQVFSLSGSQSYALTGGTSAAAPQLSGAIALLYSAPLPGLMALQKANPAMAALQVKDWIMRGVDSLPQFQGINVSGGRLNIGKAILLALAEDSLLACPAPLGLQLKEAKDEQFVLSWYDEGADSVQIRFRRKGEEWGEKTLSQTHETILSLQKGSEYEIRMRALCGGEKSRWNPFFVSTKQS